MRSIPVSGRWRRSPLIICTARNDRPFTPAAGGGGPDQMSLLELFAFAFGIISVYLSVRQNIWSWPTAIVNVVLYVFVFREARLYSDMGLQVVYAILSCYGWYEWLYGGR